MSQLSFADSEFVQKRRTTHKERFLAKMEKLVPWRRLIGIIDPKRGNGRPPQPLEIMIRIHCLQQWYSLSDEGMEDALYEISSMRLSAGFWLERPIPDRTTIINFQHLLEKHRLRRAIFTEINDRLMDSGIILKEDNFLVATIINAPTSTRNKEKQLDPDMCMILIRPENCSMVMRALYPVMRVIGEQSNNLSCRVSPLSGLSQKIHPASNN